MEEDDKFFIISLLGWVCLIIGVTFYIPVAIGMSTGLFFSNILTMFIKSNVR